MNRPEATIGKMPKRKSFKSFYPKNYIDPMTGLKVKEIRISRDTVYDLYETLIRNTME